MFGAAEHTFPDRKKEITAPTGWNIYTNVLVRDAVA
jgi:hypothetical protein